MKLPKHYFDNLSAAKYREYLKLLPDLQKENVKAITMLIFTFSALSFFGIFAINPTLSTIITLKKQLADTTFVEEQLVTKINNLSSLQTKYNLLETDLPVLMDAIPETAAGPTLMGQIASLAQNAGLHVRLLQIAEVQLTAPKLPPTDGQSFVFTLEATGAYEDMARFITAVSRFNRIVTLESVSIVKDPKQNTLVLDIRGREYFQK